MIKSHHLFLDNTLGLAGDHNRIVKNILKGEQESSSDGALADLGTDTYNIHKSREK